MPRAEQLARLKKSVKAWNIWRLKNDDKIDLRGADLNGADLIEADLRRTKLRGAALSGANLGGANLSGVNLSGANLGEAYLSEANLSAADLVAANLSGADLSMVDFRGVNLAGAVLRGADLLAADLLGAYLRGADLSRAALNWTNLHVANLYETNLQGANLRGANLLGAMFGETSFGDVDLSEVNGLEDVKHLRPSSIGIDTIYKSKGKIPEVFLRGCGVPENMITFMHSLAGTPNAIEFYSCFISYSSKDEAFAKRVHADLQSKGVRVWFAPEDLKIGDKFRTRIDEAIRVYDKLMIVLSENSIASSWVEKEVEAAFEKERKENRVVLFPIRLDDRVMETEQAWAADIRRTRHIGDFSKWKEHDSYQAEFERLLRDLKAGAGA